MTRSIVRNALLLAFLSVAFCSTPTVAGLLNKIGITCEGQTAEDGSPLPVVNCLAGGVFNTEGGQIFSGTYMCREERSLIFWKKNVTKCVPTITNAVIGEVGDQCGCCGDACPVMCTCACNNEGHVLVYKQTGLFSKKEQCISPGKASRWIADETEAYSCVPDAECPTIAPTAAPSTWMDNI